DEVIRKPERTTKTSPPANPRSNVGLRAAAPAWRATTLAIAAARSPVRPGRFPSLRAGDASGAAGLERARPRLAGRIRLAIDRLQPRLPVGHESLGARPVLLVVDVEALVALGHERRQDAALSPRVLEGDAPPRDLER